jgi:hypothetical protein
MNSLFFSYNYNVDKAYIIRVKGNNNSEKLALNCASSCEEVGMPYEYWDAYDGLSDTIIIPDHHNLFMKLVKVTDHYLTRGEVACALSHISLWVKCVEQDQPIVILEHDTLMTRAYIEHAVFNSIAYLGSREQVYKGWGVYATPPHASEGPNYHFICRAHAYAIDPAIAKNMLAHILKFGISAPLDIILRTDIFPMHQMGIYAHDVPNPSTTILGRPLKGRRTDRNDDLKH